MQRHCALQGVEPNWLIFSTARDLQRGQCCGPPAGCGAQAKKSNTDVLKPIIGVEGDKNIALRNVFGNLNNPRFDHALDLIEGKMVRKRDLDLDDDLDLSLPDFGLGELTQV